MRAHPKTSSLQVQMTEAQQAELMHLVSLGYGDGLTPASVVEYMVARALDDLRRNGIYYVNSR